MKQLKKTVLIKFLAVGMILGVLPAMSWAAFAYDGDPYAGLVNNTDKPVKFNGMDWYIIADDSEAVDKGTVTLLAKDPITQMAVGDRHDVYSDSAVAAYLESLTAGSGSFADVADAIVKVETSEQSYLSFKQKIWLLSRDEANRIPINVTISEKDPEPANESTITFDLNGGILDGQTGIVTVKAQNGSVFTLPAPVRAGYRFAYWKGSKYHAGDRYEVNGDHTFKAVWKARGKGSGSSSGKKGVKTGDDQNGTGWIILMLVSVIALGAVVVRRSSNLRR